MFWQATTNQIMVNAWKILQQRFVCWWATKFCDGIPKLSHRTIQHLWERLYCSLHHAEIVPWSCMLYVFGLEDLTDEKALIWHWYALRAWCVGWAEWQNQASRTWWHRGQFQGGSSSSKTESSKSIANDDNVFGCVGMEEKGTKDYRGGGGQMRYVPALSGRATAMELVRWQEFKGCDNGNWDERGSSSGGGTSRKHHSDTIGQRKRRGHCWYVYSPPKYLNIYLGLP